jgi:chemotaxis regulatin CheY-phosphate phosphatase CheZ
MSGKTLSRSELLKDSEATLREVAGILLELWDQGPGGNGASGGVGGNGKKSPARLGELIGVLMKTYREINGVLDGIRQGRGILQQAAMERVQKTHAKLEEVTMTTEVAATDMLDGLDRALSLVDQVVPLDAQADVDHEARRVAGEQLRDELHRLVILLQFQDITAQQLAHAAGVLAEVEDRLEGLTRLFDLHQLDPNEDFLGLGLSKTDPAVAPTFDPAASTEDAESRQALADQIFTQP